MRWYFQLMGRLSIIHEVIFNYGPFQPNFNETASYHRHILRLPIFVKKAFKKKTFFFLGKTISSSNFLAFQTFRIFKFSKKNLIIRAEKTFLRNNTIWYAFYSKIYTHIDFEEIYSKKKFSKKNKKKPKFWTFLELLLFQPHSTANLLQVGRKRISRSVAWTYLPMWRKRN